MSATLSNWLNKYDKTTMKQAGCVAGFFHLFDRQHLLRRRQSNAQAHEKNPSGQISLGAHEDEYGELCNLEENISRIYQDNCRSSTESSSKTSLSLSTKPFSSLDHKLGLGEQLPSSKKPPINTSKSKNPGMKQSPGLRNMIKESDIKVSKALKPIDSPRPLVNLSELKALEESLQLLIKLKELPLDSSRNSYDGYENSQSHKDYTKKQHRRLSLDSMEDSARCDFNSKFNSLVKELKRNTGYRVSEPSNLLQNLESNASYPNIVAKLMGLDPINPAKKPGISGKSSLSPTNSPKSQSTVNQPLLKSKSNSRFAVAETRSKKTVVSIDGETKQKNKETSRKISVNLIFRSGKLENEKALKSPIAILKPGSKSAVPSSSQFEKFEDSAGLRRIRTSDSSKRKKEASDEDQTPTGKSVNSFMKSLSKERTSSVNPRLGKKKPDQEVNCGTNFRSYELKKIQREAGNRQQSESVSPRCKINQKPSIIQDNIQKRGKKAVSDGRNQNKLTIPRDLLYANELDAVSVPLSSPISVLTTSLYPDDSSLSPSSQSSTSNREDLNQPSDHNLKTMHLHPSVHSNQYLTTGFQSSETTDTVPLQFVTLGTAVDKTGVAEPLLRSSEPPHLPALIGETKLAVPAKTITKNNAQAMTKDLLRRSKDWDEFKGETPAVALEIESLVFGDLISEIVSSMRTARGTYEMVPGRRRPEMQTRTRMHIASFS